MPEPMPAAVTEDELADQCPHVCLKPDDHEGPHFYGYLMGPWSQAGLVAEVRRLQDKVAALQGELVDAELAAAEKGQP